MQNKLGHTLLIVNPAAQSGKGATAGVQAAEILQQAGVTLEVQNTEAPLHAVELAAAAERFDTVIALGGDGVIHESANGLMQIAPDQRPVFGIIPVGSGNDYARTLGISKDIPTACQQLLGYHPRKVDVGCCNGRYFVETLSFGIDAAIALDTVERRKHTHKTDTALYFEAGLNQILFHRDIHTYTAQFDQEEPQKGQSLTFAVQLGRTYGGGFQICPDADPSDGLFDLCIAHPPLGLIGAVALFAKAKDGKHTGAEQIELRRARQAVLRFDSVVPAQMDGEDCTGMTFDVSLEHAALSVLFAQP